MANSVPAPGQLEGLWECHFCSNRHDPGAARQPRPRPLFSSKVAFVFHFNSTCHICDIKFTSQASARIHRRVHKSSSVKHVCNLCNANFADQQQFSDHIRSHKPYKCVSCASRFRGFEGLRQHCASGTCRIRDKLLALRRDRAAVSQSDCFACGHREEEEQKQGCHCKTREDQTS